VTAGTLVIAAGIQGRTTASTCRASRITPTTSRVTPTTSGLAPAVDGITPTSTPPSSGSSRKSTSSSVSVRSRWHRNLVGSRRRLSGRCRRSPSSSSTRVATGGRQSSNAGVSFGGRQSPSRTTAQRSAGHIRAEGRQEGLNAPRNGRVLAVTSMFATGTSRQDRVVFAVTSLLATGTPGNGRVVLATASTSSTARRTRTATTANGSMRRQGRQGGSFGLFLFLFQGRRSSRLFVTPTAASMRGLQGSRPSRLFGITATTTTDSRKRSEKRIGGG